MPPAKAPGMLPSPPRTTATNISTMKFTATFGSMGWYMASSPPAAATSAMPTPKATPCMARTLMPW